METVAIILTISFLIGGIILIIVSPRFVFVNEEQLRPPVTEDINIEFFPSKRWRRRRSMRGAGNLLLCFGYSIGALVIVLYAATQILRLHGRNIINRVAYITWADYDFNAAIVNLVFIGIVILIMAVTIKWNIKFYRHLEYVHNLTYYDAVAEAVYGTLYKRAYGNQIILNGQYAAFEDIRRMQEALADKGCTCATSVAMLGHVGVGTVSITVRLDEKPIKTPALQ